MALLTGMTPDGQEVPVQVDTNGRLIAEGLTGPQGPQGLQGPTGPLGPQGPIGPAGSPADVWSKNGADVYYNAGRVLVGTSSARDKFNNATSGQDPLVQFESAGTSAKDLYMLSLTANNNSASSNAGVSLMLARSGGSSVGSYTLVANGDSIGRIRFQGADGSEFVEAAMIEAYVDGTPGANDMPGRLVFSTTADGASSPTERMRITNDGRLFVGYTSSSNTIAGVVNAVGYAHKQGTGSAPGSSAFNFFWTGSLQVWIDTSNVGNVTLTSDYRIKKNIASQADLAIPRIKQLRPVTYERANYKELFKEDGVLREGFIAHELAEVIPSAVEGEKDAENQIQSINIDALVSVLTKALQEAVAKIETLEAKVAALETA